MSDPRLGAGDLGPGENAPGPSSFPRRSRGGRGAGRRPIAFPGRKPPKQPEPADSGVGTPGFGSASVSCSADVSGGVPGAGSGRASVSDLAEGREVPPSAALRPASDDAVSGEPAGAEPPAEFAAVAAEVFGNRLGLAREFARLLVTDGVVRGLIGPREAPRIWERHLINCAVMAKMIPIGSSVVDVGSGAGLPGIVLAVARPDLSITLVEPLARRTAFLSEAVAALGLDATVQVVRGRAEDVVDGPPAGADVITARAVAALDRLAGWCLPLARVGGRLLALKGASAADEIAQHRAAIAELGGSDPVVHTCGDGLIDPPTTVVEIVKVRDVVPARPKPSVRAAGSGRPAGERGGRDSGRGRTRRG